MIAKEDGVAKYTHWTLDIYMPEGKESCRYCPCLKFDNDRDARFCKHTGEILDGYKYSMGIDCPLNKIKPEEDCNANSK